MSAPFEIVPVPDVVEEHLDELAFLFVQRRKIVFSPDSVAAQLAWHDERIAAHYDAARTNGDGTRRAATERLDEPGDPWDVFGALLALLSLDSTNREEALKRVGALAPDHGPAVREALRRLPPARFRELFPPDRASEVPETALAAAVDGWGWHGILTPERTRKYGESGDGEVRRAVARHFGHAADAAVRNAAPVERLLGEEDPGIRNAALFSQALANPGVALSHCRRELTKTGDDPFLLLLPGLLGGPFAADVLASKSRDAETAIVAIRSLGELGDVSGVDPLLSRLSDEDDGVKDAARAALETILGELPAATEGEDEAEVLRKFWFENRSRYGAATRWRRGRPVPFDGPEEETPMESAWLAAILSPEGPPELRREIPDGFLTGVISEEALPGE